MNRGKTLRMGACGVLTGLFLVTTACDTTIDAVNEFDPEAAEQLKAKSVIEGRLELEGGATPSDIAVSLEGTSKTGQTNEVGEFKLTEVPAGVYTLRAAKVGYKTSTKPGIVVALGANVKVDALKLPIGRAQVTGAAKVEGADAAGGVTVSLVRVSADDAKGVGSATGSAEGALTAAPVRRDLGSYQDLLTKGGFASKQFAQTAGEGGTGGDPALPQTVSGLTGGDGVFTISDVPVGQYFLTAAKEGLAPVCAGLLTVIADGDLVRANTLTLAPASGVIKVVNAFGDRVDFTNADTIGLELFLFNAVQMRVGASAAEIENQAFEPFNVNVTMPLGDGDGPRTFYAQFKDQCGFSTPVFEANVIVDRTPPEMLSLEIAGGAPYVTDPAGATFIEMKASDGEGGSGIATMTIGIDPDGFEGGGELVEQAPQPYAEQHPISLGAADGLKGVRVVLTDAAGNVSEEPEHVEVEKDSTPPDVNPAEFLRFVNGVTVENGATIARQSVITVEFDVEAEPGLTMAVAVGTPVSKASPFVPFQRSLRLEIPGEDREAETISAMFKDAAGNTTEALSTVFAINRKGDLTGKVLLEEQSDHSGTVVTLTGTGLSTTSGAGGSYTFTDLPAGPYAVEFSHTGYRKAQIPQVTVFAGKTLDVPEVALEEAKGSMKGVARLEGESQHGGITVTAEGEGISVATVTSAAGSYTFVGLRAGPYTLRAERVGFREAVGSVVVTADQTAEVAALVLAINPGQISGFVKLQEDRGAAIDVSVDREGVPPVQAVKGAYTFKSLPQGTYSVTAKAQYYVSQTTVVEVRAGQGATAAALTLPLETGEVTGKVEMSDGTSAAGLTVQMTGTASTTLSVDTAVAAAGDGSFRFREVPVGSGYKVKVARDGYTAAEKTGVTVTADGVASAGTLILALNPGSVKGKVVVQDGLAAAVTVSINAPGVGNVTPAGDGSFTLNGVPQGAFTITARASSFDDAVVTVKVEAGKQATAPDLFLRLQTGDVRGKVTLADGGSAAGAAVRITGKSSAGKDVSVATLTSGDGTFSVAGVAVGTGYTVAASFAGYKDATATGVTVSSGAATTVPDIKLDVNPGIVQGVVTFSPSLTAPPSVVLTLSSAGTPTAALDSGGNYQFTGIKAGAYVVTAQAQGMATAQRTVVVTAGATATAEQITLAAARGSVTGKVALSGGGNPAGASVQLTGTSTIGLAVSQGATAAADGTFRFDNVLAGSAYTVKATLRGYTDGTSSGVAVQDGATNALSDITLSVNPGSVSGNVQLFGQSNHSGVTAQVSGTSNAGVAVSQSAASGANGDYTVSGIAEGTYTLTLSKSGFVGTSLTVQVSAGAATAVAQKALDVSRGAIKGKFLLAGETSHSGIQVSLTNTAFSTFTVSTGDFTLSGIPVGSYELKATKDGFVTKTYASVAVTDTGDTVLAQFTMSKATGVFVINSGADYTKSRTVSLDFIPSGNEVQMRLSEKADFSDAPTFVAFTDPANFTITSAGNGLKRVYAQFKDGAGATSSAFDDTIILDDDPPKIGTFTINGGATDSNAADGIVTLNIAATDATSGVSSMRISNDAGFTNPSTAGYSVSFVHTLDTPGSDGTKSVYLVVKDIAGNETPVTGASLAAINLDRTKPTLTSFTIEDASTVNTKSSLVTLKIRGASADTTTIALSNDSGIPSPSFAPFTPPDADVAWALLPGDGLRTVYLRLKDKAGNTSAADFSDDITVDTTAPANPSITLSSGERTKNTAATATVSATGATQYYITGDVTDTATTFEWVTASFPAAVAVTLTTGDGPKVISVKFRDEAGNESATAVSSTTLDQTPPTLTGITLIGKTKNGAPSTTLTATLSIEAEISGGGGESVATSFTAPDCNALTYSQTFAPVIPVTIDATGTLYVCLKDAAGNIAGPVSDTITVDQTAPSCTITLKGKMADGTTAAPSGFTAVTTIEVASSSCTGGDPSTGQPAEIALAQVGQSLACDTAAYNTFAASAFVTVSSGDGSKNVQACYRDAAGNYTASPVTAAAAITLDQTPPTSVVLELDRNSAQPDYWNSTESAAGANLDVPAFVSASEAGTYYLARTPDFASATTGTYSPGVLGDFVQGSFLIQNVQDTPQIVYLKVVDNLGNISEVASDFIILDTAGPTVTDTTINGGDEFTNSVSVALWNDISGATEMRFKANCPAPPTACNFSGVVYQPYTFYVIYLLDGTLGDGEQRVNFQYRDAAGNETDGLATDTIVLDTTPPSSPVISNTSTVLDAGAGALDVSISLSSAGSDTYSSFGNGTLKYELEGGQTYPGWTQVSGQAPFTFKLFQDFENRFGVRLRDAAGNVSAEAYVTYIEDSTAPEPPDSVEATSGNQKVSLTWSASVSTDVQGYRVYYGASQDFGGTFANEGASPVDVGNVTQFQLTGVPNGSPIFIAVESYDRVPLYSGIDSITVADPNEVTPEISGGFGGATHDVDGVVRSTTGREYVAAVSDAVVKLYRKWNAGDIGSPGSGLLSPPPAADNLIHVQPLEVFGLSIEAMDFGALPSNFLIAVGEVGLIEFIAPASFGQPKAGAINVGYNINVTDILQCGDEKRLYAMGREPDDNTVTHLFEISFSGGTSFFPYLSASRKFTNLRGRSIACNRGATVTDNTDNTVYVLGDELNPNPTGDSAIWPVKPNGGGFDNLIATSPNYQVITGSYHAIVADAGHLYLAGYKDLAFYPLAGGVTDFSGKQVTGYTDLQALYTNGDPTGRDVTLSVFNDPSNGFAVVGGTNTTVDNTATAYLFTLNATGVPTYSGQLDSTTGPAAVQGSGTIFGTNDRVGYFAMGSTGIGAAKPLPSGFIETGDAYGSFIAIKRTNNILWALSTRGIGVLDVTNSQRPNLVATVTFAATADVLFSDESIGPLAASGTRAAVVVEDQTGCTGLKKHRLAHYKLTAQANSDKIDPLNQANECIPYRNNAGFKVDSVFMHGTYTYLSWADNTGMFLSVYNQSTDAWTQVDQVPGAQFRGSRRYCGQTPLPCPTDYVSHDCITLTDQFVSYCMANDANPPPSPQLLKVRTCNRNSPTSFPDCRDAVVPLDSGEDWQDISLKAESDILTVAGDKVRRFLYEKIPDGRLRLKALGEVNTSNSFKALSVGDEIVVAAKSKDFSVAVFENDRDIAYNLKGTLKELIPHDMAQAGHDVFLATGELGLLTMSMTTPVTFIPQTIIPRVRSGRMAGLGHLLVATDPQAQFATVDTRQTELAVTRHQPAVVADFEVNENDRWSAIVFDENGARNLIKLFRSAEPAQSIGAAGANNPVQALAVDDSQKVWTVESVPAGPGVTNSRLTYYDFAAQQFGPPANPIGGADGDLGNNSTTHDMKHFTAFGRNMFVGVGKLSNGDAFLWLYDSSLTAGSRLLQYTNNTILVGADIYDVAIVNSAVSSDTYRIFALAESGLLHSCVYDPYASGAKLTCDNPPAPGFHQTVGSGGIDSSIGRGQRLAAITNANTTDFPSIHAYAVALSSKVYVFDQDLTQMQESFVSGTPRSLAAYRKYTEKFVFVGTESGDVERFRFTPTDGGGPNPDQFLYTEGSDALTGEAITKLRVQDFYGYVVAGDSYTFTAAYYFHGLPVLARVNWLGSSTSIAISGNRVATAHPGHGIVLSEMAAGGSRLLKQFIRPDVQAFGMDGTTLIGATQNSKEVFQIDASDTNSPGTPQNVANLADNAVWMELSGGLAAVGTSATLTQWLDIVSYREGATGMPANIGRCDTAGAITTGAWIGGRVVVSDGTNKIWMVQVRQGNSLNVTCLDLNGSTATGNSLTTSFGPVKSIRTSGPYVYLTTGDGKFVNGVEVYVLDDASNSLTLVAASPTTNETDDIFPYGSLVYVTPKTGTGMNVFKVEP